MTGRFISYVLDPTQNAACNFDADTLVLVTLEIAGVFIMSEQQKEISFKYRM